MYLTFPGTPSRISSDMIFDRLNDKKFNILLRYHIISHMRSHWHKRSRYPTHNSSVCSWYDIFHLLSTRLLYFSFANSQIWLFFLFNIKTIVNLVKIIYASFILRLSLCINIFCSTFEVNNINGRRWKN